MNQPDVAFGVLAEENSDMIDWISEMTERYCRRMNRDCGSVIVEFPDRLMWALYLQAVRYYGSSGSITRQTDEDNRIRTVRIGAMYVHATGQGFLRMSCPIVMRRRDGQPIDGSVPAFDEIVLERGESVHLDIPAGFLKYAWPRFAPTLTDAQRRLVKN